MKIEIYKAVIGFFFKPRIMDYFCVVFLFSGELFIIISILCFMCDEIKFTYTNTSI